MIGEWCYFKSYFSKEYCEDIIKTAKLIDPQEASMGLSETGTSHQNLDYRRSKVRFLNSGDWRFQKLFDDLWKVILTANKDWFNFHLTKMDFVQLAEYDASYKGEYKAHHDVFWINKDPFYHRKLTALVQLSNPDEYEGGNFEILEANPAPTPEEMKDQGTVIVFPSFYRHQANPVTKGTRYSIASWVEGPKWR